MVETGFAGETKVQNHFVKNLSQKCEKMAKKLSNLDLDKLGEGITEEKALAKKVVTFDVNDLEMLSKLGSGMCFFLNLSRYFS